MATQKRSKKRKPPSKRPKPPPSRKDPPGATVFNAPKVGNIKSITVGDLRRATADTTWTVNEKLDSSKPLPRYPLGGSLEGVTVADSTRKINWPEVFSNPPKNPYLLKQAIEAGLVPAASISLLPVSLDELANIDSGSFEKKGSDQNSRKSKKRSATKGKKR